jgi:hypothetical protein
LEKQWVQWVPYHELNESRLATVFRIDLAPYRIQRDNLRVPVLLVDQGVEVKTLFELEQVHLLWVQPAYDHLEIGSVLVCATDFVEGL